MEKSNVFLDTDVILNWLTKEVDLNTGFKLWKCPYEIMKLIENKEIIAYTSITNIFEIRFVLRRKKKFPEETIKKLISNLYGEINIEIPDYVDMLTFKRIYQISKKYYKSFRHFSYKEKRVMKTVRVTITNLAIPIICKPAPEKAKF